MSKKQTGEGRVVLVIGASSGIGEATAKMLAKRGHRVFATSRQNARIALADVEALSLDVFDETSIDGAVAKVVEAEGRIDALVYSAGFYVAGAVEETPLDDVRDQLHAYFFGAVRCAQAALPHMREQKFGRLVFMSSTAGTIAIPFHAAYSASKGALGRWAEAFGYEVDPFNICVSYIEAGPIKTNAPNAMRAPRAPLPEYEERRANAEEGFKKSINGGLPPSRIARAICHAVESDRPRVRYRVGAPGKIFPFMQAMLGERRFRGVMKKSFKI
jgi:NAD(P)-dependent dehydrogenase (short-subunit alcohol dehydrogenase family)